MGRKSSISEAQRLEIMRRHLYDGEGSRTISEAMKIPETTVRRNIENHCGVIKEAGKQIVDAEKKLLDLPIVAQVVAKDYMANLRAISDNLTRAAVIGSRNALKLSEAAESAIDQATGGECVDVEGIKLANGLTRSANDSAQLGVQLIQANKDKNTEPPKPARPLSDFYATKPNSPGILGSSGA